MNLTKQQLNRFWAKVDTKTENECWEWTASKNNKGYGQFAINKIAKSTHRISYTIHKGEIPDTMSICHTCNNPPCVNPKHLYIGTDTQNMRQAADEKRLASQKKTHCKSGHEFTPQNTALYKQKKRGDVLTRVCRTCKKLNDQKRSNRLK